ncbi:hypothetical protein NDU88_002974 [Pleurodeles waltl]|uniref:Uncharacterized protein n=1 Tax=Pleurodeles waltl TaxID=8319 RepID=A0AAV7NF39_PLEWA|nr:hypothetical protein NDU88_002974 [Pleurodeles waltl]
MDPWGNGTEDIGNPDTRIPVHVPGKQTEEDAIAIPGNPDIRVPEEVEREDGLRARSALLKEDAKEGEAERRGRAEKAPDQAQEEEQKDTSPGDNPKGREGPEEHERHHVPGGNTVGGNTVSSHQEPLGKKETTENHYPAGL